MEVTAYIVIVAFFIYIMDLHSVEFLVNSIGDHG